tara:strand:+ start:284 stop:484 length:201 start_codon:yes stop_codon:yes gene_type:complete
MYYLVKIWNNDQFKKEILFEADNDVIAMQKASAATPDGCRANYESINKEEYENGYKKTEAEEQAEA